MCTGFVTWGIVSWLHAPTSSDFGATLLFFTVGRLGVLSGPIHHQCVSSHISLSSHLD